MNLNLHQPSGLVCGLCYMHTLLLQLTQHVQCTLKILFRDILLELHMQGLSGSRSMHCYGISMSGTARMRSGSKPLLMQEAFFRSSGHQACHFLTVRRMAVTLKQDQKMLPIDQPSVRLSATALLALEIDSASLSGHNNKCLVLLQRIVSSNLSAATLTPICSLV